jgi:hypothetical protein
MWGRAGRDIAFETGARVTMEDQGAMIGGKGSRAVFARRAKWARSWRVRTRAERAHPSGMDQRTCSGLPGGLAPTRRTVGHA